MRGFSVDRTGRGLRVFVVITHLSPGKRLARPSFNKGALTNGNAYDDKVLSQDEFAVFGVICQAKTATLFFAVYDDSSREMAYVNCGHNAPLWLRQDGSLERLAATATVIGLFEQWECSVEQIRLAQGDLLVIFSDGVTEAAHNEEEFGEARLIQELQGCSHLSASEIVQAVFASVQEFSAGTQSDDLTLLIAKARS